MTCDTGTAAAVETVPFDAAQYLTDPEEQAELLTEAFTSGHAPFITAALGAVARARGMSAVATDAGVTRSALNEPFAPDGDPRLSTVLGVLEAVGLSLSTKPIAPTT